MKPPWHETILDIWRHGQRLSAVGPGPLEDHLAHSLALAHQLDEPRQGVDLGSGAGIPALVLASYWNASTWLLIEAAQRRVRLLEGAIERLDLGARVTVVHARAEDVARSSQWRGSADLVTARSFGPPAVTAECGAALLADDGLLVVTEPPDTDERRWPDEELAKLGLATVSSPRSDVVRIQRLRRVGPVPDGVPRRAGIPAKRPHF